MESDKLVAGVAGYLVSAPSPDKSADVDWPYCSCRARLAAPGFPAKALNTGVLTAGHPVHTSHTQSDF